MLCDALVTPLTKIMGACEGINGGGAFLYDNGDLDGSWVYLLPDLDCTGGSCD